MKPWFIFPLILLICFSCKTKLSDHLEGKWNLVNAGEESPNDVNEKVLGTDWVTLVTGSLFPHDFLFLSDAARFSRVAGGGAGNYKSGTWTVNETDSLLILISDGPEPVIDTFRINRCSEDKLTLAKMTAGGRRLVYTYEYENFRPGKMNDFTRRELNWWSNKPSAPESPAQLRERVINGMEFYRAYLDYYHNAGNTKMLNRPVLIPLRFTRYGSSIVPGSKEPAAWIRTFYNRNQASDAFIWLNQQLSDHEYESNAEDPVRKSIEELEKMIEICRQPAGNKTL